MKKLWFWGLAVAVLVGIALVWSSRENVHVPEGAFLLVDLEGDYSESPPSPFVERLLPGSSNPFLSLLSQFSKVGRDERVAGILLRIRDLEIGWAKSQEIREVIKGLSGEGRKVIAYLETENLAANLEYYIASAADEIYLTPGMRNPLLGLAAEYFFLGEFFDQFGVSFEYERIGPYKTAVETFTRDTMSVHNREMTNWLIDSINSQFLHGIAQSRKIEIDQLRTIVDSAPVSLERLKALGLIDGISGFPDLLRNLGIDVVTSRDYEQVDIEDLGFSPDLSIAVVYASGPVATGKAKTSITGSRQVNSQVIAETLDKIARSDSIDALILRIDSPGGSALASDIVWDAIQQVRRTGKPVVASLSDIAASGGYYIAAGADVIVASPGTITGSIGVFVLRPVFEELLHTLKIGTVHEVRGEFADLSLLTKPLSEGSRKRLQEEMKQVYERFLNRVASGRNISKDVVDLNGRGKVFTGIQAKERGLVDVLGGIDVAIREATRLLGYKERKEVLLVPLPRPRSLLQQLRGGLFSRATDTILSERFSRLPRGLRELSQVPVGSPVLFSTLIPNIR